MGKVRKAGEKAIMLTAPSRDAVVQFLTPRSCWEKTSFLLDGREHLRLVKVPTADLSAYCTLLSAGGVT